MFSSSLLLCYFLLKTVKNKIIQIIAIKIKLKITIHAISPFLRPLLSDELKSDEHMSSDVLRTSKLPNVSFKYIKLVYIYFNAVHPWNAFGQTFGSSVPKYWIQSRL